MRKLASIQKITKLEPIENADAIECASVLGWKVVVRKGEFSPGDKCVYIEIDSVVPEREEFEFLRSKKFKIKTVRLRGQISQGICFPLSILPDGDVEEDRDVTEVLGVIKYEPPIEHIASLGGERAGGFPCFMPKTDETRVQVLQHILDRYVGKECYVTEKLDGSSATIFYNQEEFGVCTRNHKVKPSDKNFYWIATRELGLEDKLKSLGLNVSLQGELVGPKIQKNKYRFAEPTIYFFNVYDIDTGKYYSFQDTSDLLKDLDLNMVPVLDTQFKLVNNIDELIAVATRKSTVKEDIWAEGIVIRPLEEIVDINNNGYLHSNRVSFKVINPEFLLKHKD